jgi:hypothetical protein
LADSPGWPMAKRGRASAPEASAADRRNERRVSCLGMAAVVELDVAVNTSGYKTSGTVVQGINKRSDVEARSPGCGLAGSFLSPRQQPHASYQQDWAERETNGMSGGHHWMPFLLQHTLNRGVDLRLCLLRDVG